MLRAAILFTLIIFSGTEGAAEGISLNCKNTATGEDQPLLLNAARMSAQFGTGNPGKVLYWGDDDIRWVTVTNTGILAFMFQQNTYRLIADGVLTNHFDYLDQINRIGMDQIVLPKDIYQCRRS
jgi:hypothetical protein